MAVIQTRNPLLLITSLVFIGLSHGYVEKSAVPGSLEEIFHSHVRVRRMTEKTGFTQGEKDSIVAKHNEFRRVPNAANMLHMSWDNELETLAQNWANKCKYSHNPNRAVASTGTNAGENLYARSPNYNGETAAIISWNNEVSDYTYSSNACAPSKACGHYTQIVWAQSDKIGCGVKYCPTAEGLDWTDVYLVVCNYLVAGNLIGSKPYVEGASCSQCPSGKTTCDNKLCRDPSSMETTPETPTTTPGTPTTTPGTPTTTPETPTTTSGTTAVTTTSTTVMVMMTSLLWVKMT